VGQVIIGMVGLLALVGTVLAGALMLLTVLARPAPAREATVEWGAAPPAAEAAPESAAPAFSPFWVKNHRTTGMWSGPAGTTGVVGFGTTSAAFCSFLVVREQDNSRLHVFNPFSEDYFWIDAEAIGPAGPPAPTSEPKPADQNCADPLHEP